MPAFKPGESGNMWGRPRKTDEQRKFESKCREWSARHAFEKLSGWVESENPKVATWALGEILDRGYGKSEQSHYVEGNITSESPVSIDAIVGEIASLVSGQEAKGIEDNREDKMVGGK